MTAPCCRYLYTLLIAHPGEPRLLALRTGHRWSLPQWETTERHYWQVTEPILAHVRELLSQDVFVRRCLDLRFDAVGGCDHRLYELECLPPVPPLPPRARWIGPEALPDLAMPVPEQQVLVEAAVNEWVQGTVPANRRPWARSGWRESALDWIQEQMRLSGHAASGPVVQTRTWERACLLRLSTATGRLYFKAVPAMFAHEPRLACYLAENVPAVAPRVLAVGSKRHWMLMEDAGAQTLNEVLDPARWEEALRRYSQLQIQLAERTDDLFDMGCPDRRLDTLVEQIKPLLTDHDAMLAGRPGGLEETEIEQLRTLVPTLKAMCTELGCHPIPPSLEHGDFWAGQMIVNGEQYRFIDWSDSSVSHPFFSLLYLFETTEAEGFLADGEDRLEHLRDAYLEPWAAYAPWERLLPAFRLAMRLAPLHHAAIYYRDVLPQMEARWEMEQMIPYYLRILLRLNAA